jgi:hypothetical protein
MLKVKMGRKKRLMMRKRPIKKRMKTTKENEGPFFFSVSIYCYLSSILSL